MSGLTDWVAHSFNCICRHISLGVAAGCMRRLSVQHSSSQMDTFVHELVIMSSSALSEAPIQFILNALVLKYQNRLTPDQLLPAALNL